MNKHELLAGVALALVLALPAEARKKPSKKPAAAAKVEAKPEKKPEKKAEKKPEPKTAPHEVIARYEKAIGGAAFKDLQDRLVAGSVDFAPTGGGASRKGALELAWTTDGKAREAWTLPDGKLRRTYDGKKGWIVGPGIKRRALRASERAELSRLAALYQPALIVPLDELVLERDETRDGRLVHVLKTRNGDLVWFDALTALPVRLDLMEERPEPERAGEFVASQVTFGDWSYVGAVQVPHVLHRVRPDGETTYTLAEVRHNVRVPAKLFKKPTWWRK